MAQREFTQYFQPPGWVDHDAREIWQTQLVVLREMLVHAGITARQVRALGINNQRETTVLRDRQTGEPVAPVIVWQDRRTSGFCGALRAAGHAPGIAANTGLVVDAYFSGTKLALLLEHVPGVRLRAERGELAFGTVDSWLLWQLTGGRVHATELSNASRMLLFNLKTGTWDDGMLALLSIPHAVLPQILPSCGQVA